MKIIAVVPRYYKCYGVYNMVPLLFGDGKIVGFVGENGAGKSAVLQSLYSFFANKKWIRNKHGKKGVSECGVAPIVACTIKDISKKFTDDEIVYLEKQSILIEKALKENDILHEDECLYISCIFFQDSSVKLFNGTAPVSIKDSSLKILSEKVLDFIRGSFRYIYIDAEVDIDNSTDINSETANLIKGSKIVGDLTKRLDNIIIKDGAKKKKISEIISEHVVKYLDSEVVKKLKKVDERYEYKNLKSGAHSNLTNKHLSELATKALFGNRCLTQKVDGKDIGISDMSSGERRRVFLDFVIVMLNNLSKIERERVILGIDEPEISVDAGSRIQQFEKLNSLSENNISIAFTTHWFGWMFQNTRGNVVLINTDSQNRKIISGNTDFFLTEFIENNAPYEMRVMFDFLTSLGTLAEKQPEQKFVICEGVTDFNYLRKHFIDYIIIPLRGIGDVLKMYNTFLNYYFKTAALQPSNIIFLIDTDPDKNPELSNITKWNNLRRISLSNSHVVELVKNSGDNTREKCDIEDVLSPATLLKALKKSSDLLDNDIDREFINTLKIKHEGLSGLIAFGMDRVEIGEFRKIFKGKYKVKVSEVYDPNSEEKQVFRNVIKLFYS